MTNQINRIIRHTVFSALFILVSITSAVAQTNKIPGTDVSFTLPSGEWKYLETYEVNKDVSVYLYSYAAEDVVSPHGDTIVPFVKIYVHRNYTGSVYDLAYSRYVHQPFESIEEFTTGVPQKGLGYVGAYTDAKEKRDYQFRMVYFKVKNTAIEFRCETTLDTFKQFDPRFSAIISSLKVSTGNAK